MLRYIVTLLLLLAFSATLISQTYSVSGQVNSVFNGEVGGVEIDLLDADNNLIESQTIDCGQSYSFSGLAEGQTYQLKLNKEGNLFNGISTFDLVLLSKHLLGIQELGNEYLVRAADVDDSGTTSVMDLIQLRAWILALEIDLPVSQWLFFQENAGTEGPVFQLVLMADQINYDFIAAKRGDMNGSAAPCE